MPLSERIGERLRLMRFGLIGAAAAAMHYWAAIALVELGGLAPLRANVGAFAIAFWCSYFGHRHWTFADRRGGHPAAVFFRFLATALLGFLLNQWLYYLLLTYLTLPYFISLAIVMVIVAASTYLLSRLWAFRAEQLP
ncbi:GtrA family protein [Oxalobacteraceae bacterium CAVE-383]|nr:GtrA family protein [Oxalobacteraceae bacterium CAVE-383]